MSVDKLKPCPNCDECDYKYAQDYGFETKEMLKDAAKVAMNPVGTSLSIARKVYQGVVRDLDGYPVLRCKNCHNLVVCCIHCNQYTILPALPRMDELVRCVKCKRKFQATRFNLRFSRLMAQ